jgi:hypothetical protein
LEFKAPGTPQQKGRVERALATFIGKTRSMLNTARITIPKRMAKCDNLSVQNIEKEKEQLSAS